MNKKELKQMMKPIIKECMHEILLSEGILSNIIAEVLKGTNTTITEQPKRTKNINEVFSERTKRTPRIDRTKDTRRKLMESIGSDSYNGVNIFEGTQPLSSGGSAGGETKPEGALAGYESNDPGVDISGIMNIAGNSWQKFK